VPGAVRGAERSEGVKGLGVATGVELAAGVGLSDNLIGVPVGAGRIKVDDGARGALAAIGAAVGVLLMGIAGGVTGGGLGSAREGVGLADRLTGGDGRLIQSTALTTLTIKSATMPAPRRMSDGGENDWARRRVGPESGRGAGLSVGVTWRSR